MENIIVSIKSNYGREAIYPINATACKFAALVGTKTLSRNNIETIKSLGFTVTVQAEEL
ncbi:MAG: hypothetical protein ACOH18_05540 [Candidatus Saccharimonadaceae bacterium]